MATAHHKEHLKQYLNSYKSPVKTEQQKKSENYSSSSNSEKTSSPSANNGKHIKNAGAIPKTSSTSRKLSKEVKKTSLKGNVTFAWLPDEIVLKIFSDLDACDILVCARVCRKWLQLACDNSLWESLYNKYAPKIQLTTATKQWKQECIRRCVEHRNTKAMAHLKKIHVYTGLPANTPKALERAGVQWHLNLIDNRSIVHTLKQSDVFHFPMSTTIRWYSLEIPSVKTIRKLQLYSFSAIFFDKQGKPYSNSPCQRSLILDMQFDWSKWSLTQPPGGVDERIHIYSLPEGLLVATWKEDGELAFFSLCIHNNMLLQRCLNGTSSSIYEFPAYVPVLDDVDTQYGLHGYSCTVELRSMRNSIWSQQFTQVHSKAESFGGSCATFYLIRPDHTVDHVIIPKRLNFPWKTDLFKGIVEDFCIVDVTLLDERNIPMWCISSPVKVTSSGMSDNFDYDGNTYTMQYADKKGKVQMQLIWVPEREQYFITGLLLHMFLQTINEWFGTKY